MALTESLSAMLQDLNARRNALTNQMKYLNVAWGSAPPVASPARGHVLSCGRLERIYRDLSYLRRWWQHLDERIVQLSH